MAFLPCCSTVGQLKGSVKYTDTCESVIEGLVVVRTFSCMDLTEATVNVCDTQCIVPVECIRNKHSCINNETGGLQVSLL